MVFRKPYGFLIKYFRLIHVIITGILAFLVSINSKMYTYLVSCIDNPVNRYVARDYINYSIFIYIAIGVLLFFIICLLFKYKDKPRKLYILSILGYVIIAVFMFILFGYFSELPNSIIEQKTIRGYRDVMLITLCFQYLIMIIMFIRGLGFNIKKFNFDKDIQELNLLTEDNEEIEVDVNIDTTDIMRRIRKQKRELGYYFQEYKIIILGMFAIILVIVVANVYNNYKGIFKYYAQGEFFGNVNHIIVNNSYYNIGENKNYVIIGFDIFRYGKQDRLELNNMILKIDDQEYLPNKNICYKFNDLGNCYKKQYINDKSSSYIIVYEVDNLNIEKIQLLYKETYDDIFKVKLNLINQE